jgi:hypothetical protein
MRWSIPGKIHGKPPRLHSAGDAAKQDNGREYISFSHWTITYLYLRVYPIALHTKHIVKLAFSLTKSTYNPTLLTKIGAGSLCCNDRA